MFENYLLNTPVKDLTPGEMITAIAHALSYHDIELNPIAGEFAAHNLIDPNPLDYIKECGLYLRVETCYCSDSDKAAGKCHHIPRLKISTSCTPAPLPGKREYLSIHSDNHTEIGLSMAKTATKIARDITRRIWPEYGAYCAEINARARIEHNKKLDQLIARNKLIDRLSLTEDQHSDRYLFGDGIKIELYSGGSIAGFDLAVRNYGRHGQKTVELDTEDLIEIVELYTRIIERKRAPRIAPEADEVSPEDLEAAAVFFDRLVTQEAGQC